MSLTIPIPEKAKISLKVEVDSTFNISAFVARQKANLFLLMHLGELVSAGQPELWMEKQIYCACRLSIHCPLLEH